MKRYVCLLFVFLLAACGDGNRGDNVQQELSGGELARELVGANQDSQGDSACQVVGEGVTYSLTRHDENLISLEGETPDAVITFQVDTVLECGQDIKAIIFVPGLVEPLSAATGGKRLNLTGRIGSLSQSLPVELESLLEIYNQNPLGKVSHFYSSDAINEAALTEFVQDVIGEGLPPRLRSFPDSTGELSWEVTETLQVEPRGAAPTVRWFVNGSMVGEGLALVVGNENLEPGENSIIVEVSNVFGSTIYTMSRTLLAAAVNSPPRLVNLNPATAFEIEEHGSGAITWGCLDNETVPENLILSLAIDGTEVFLADNLPAGGSYVLDVDALGLSGSGHEITFGCQDDGTDNYGELQESMVAETVISLNIMPVDDPPTRVKAFFPTPIFADGATIFGSCKVEDEDGGSWLTVGFFLDGVYIDNDLALESFRTRQFIKGQTLSLQCTAGGVTDTFEAIVQNSPPQVSDVWLSPGTVRPCQQPGVDYQFEDIDGDTDLSIQRWYVNQQYLGSTIRPDDFVAGDVLTFSVTPYDGTSYGETKQTSVTVAGGVFDESDFLYVTPRRFPFIDGFYLGRYEVTQCQWESVMGNNPSYHQDCGANCPVENVNWFEVQDFVTELNRQAGRNYRLPDAIEWIEFYNYAHESCAADEEGACVAYGWGRLNSQGVTHPVGLKLPTGQGFFDLLGNVQEFVTAWHDPARLSGAMGGDFNADLGVMNSQTVQTGTRRPGLGFRLAFFPE